MEFMFILQYMLPVISMVAARIESYFDAKGKVTEHLISAIVRVVIAVGLSTIIFWSPYYIAIYSAILLCSFWIVFDPSYNYTKGNKLWYIGNSSKVDKKARKLFKKEGGFNYLAAKLWLMVMLLIAFSF